MIFFGIVEFGIGALCILLLVFGIFGFVAASHTNQPGMPVLRPSQMAASLSIYLIAGVMLLTLGVGSMLARRWARDLSLIASWMWLILGISTAATMIWILPRFMAQSPPDQTGSVGVVMTCMAIAAGLLGIVVPAALILFYRSPHVRATCIALDPHARWTERVALPLLALSLWMAAAGVMLASMSFYAVLPLGATILTGPVAIAVYIALGIINLYVAWGLYRQSRAAWFTGIAYTIVTAIYAAVVFPRIDYDKLSEAMNFPRTRVVSDFTGIYRSPVFAGYLAVFWVLILGYFVYVYRYLSRRDEPAASLTH